MKNIVIGILAHVDAGKTTLSEAMLYLSGSIRKLGRVDNQDAFLDTDVMERERGITIFSKQASFMCENIQITLLDTPGHTDFSAEMERTLKVLDYAILVISGSDGVQGHTQTLWRLLEEYHIPVFLFVNKMDQNRYSKETLLKELCTRLHPSCMDFTIDGTESFYEELAVNDEQLFEDYLSGDDISDTAVQLLISRRQVFPCYFGSALKLTGVKEMLTGFMKYTSPSTYQEEFGAKVYKIVRDEMDTRLTYMRITGGCLRVKTPIGKLQEKVNQIRIYHGSKYDTVNEVSAGSICAVTGLNSTYPGEGLGVEKESKAPFLEPVLNYQLILPKGCDIAAVLPKLRMLEEEEPELHLLLKEENKEIHVQLMGEVQTEILKRRIWDRFGYAVNFGASSVLYKETILNTVEGIGHYEPLRHYAEVHLLLEPLPRGSGVHYAINCSEEILDKNWQHLILTHLMERDYQGVLTGSSITDIKMTLVSGRAHLKHTEGGDFRQATYRSVRQGLLQAESVLLEPYYKFSLSVPEQMLGRAMTDLENLSASFSPAQIEQGFAIVEGICPVAAMQNYQKEVIAYTRGQGELTCRYHGYDLCHNMKEVIEQTSYDALGDLENPSGSVFCAHGAGFFVPWDQVKEYMHLESVLSSEKKQEFVVQKILSKDEFLAPEEIDDILEKATHANKREGKSNISFGKHKIQHIQPQVTRVYQPQEAKEEYLLVDGYNIIFWQKELKDLANINLQAARDKLLDLLCNYQGSRQCKLMVVFDAYRVSGHDTEVLTYHNIFVVFTKEAETADQYIEKFAHENVRKYQITVATSDGLEQIIIRSKGAALMSARDLVEDMKRYENINREHHMVATGKEKNYLFDEVSKEVSQELNQLRLGNEYREK